MREQSEGRQRDSERLQEAGGPLGYGKKRPRCAVRSRRWETGSGEAV